MSSGSSGSQKRKVENMEEFSGKTTERKKQPPVKGSMFARSPSSFASSSTSTKGKERAFMTTVPMIYPSRIKVRANEFEDQLDPFVAIVQQAKETDKKLLEVMTNHHDVVYLPSLSPNKFQDCFHFMDGELPLLRRNHHDQIYNAIMKALNEENSSRGLHIYGPSGLGKSYSLYYLVSELRLQSYYRVTYINSCEEWWSSHQIEPYQYLLNELLCTFNKDELTPLTITDWAELVMYGLTNNIQKKLSEVNLLYNAKVSRIIEYLKQSETNNRKERFHLFLKELANYFKNDYWIWVFDQCNALYKHEVHNEYPFVLVNGLSGILNNSGLIIVSETSNNDACRFKSWNKLNLFDGYDDDEFNQWCTLRGYDDNKAQMDYVKYWTSAYPLELDIWYDTPAGNLQEKTENYLGLRESIIARDYQIYQDNLSKKRAENLNACVTSMILQTEPPLNKTYDMDHRFMRVGSVSFLDENEEFEIETILAIHPLTRLAITHSHGQNVINDLNEATLKALQSDEYTVDSMERITASYITTILDIMRKFEFRCWNFGNPSSNVFDKNIIFDKVIRLVNNDLSSIKDFKEYKNVLLIPEYPKYPNYPGVDFFIWNREEGVLLAFQIAIDKIHDRKNVNHFNEDWSRLCGINESKIYFIWITFDNVIEKVTKMIPNKLHVSFSSISDQFPIFKAMGYNFN